VGIDIIKRSLKLPIKSILSNAGFEPAVIVGKLEQDNDKRRGFNAATG